VDSVHSVDSTPLTFRIMEKPHPIELLCTTEGHFGREKYTVYRMSHFLAGSLTSRKLRVVTYDAMNTPANENANDFVFLKASYCFCFISGQS
jgi:hypothetical protein